MEADEVGLLLVRRGRRWVRDVVDLRAGAAGAGRRRSNHRGRVQPLADVRAVQKKNPRVLQVLPEVRAGTVVRETTSRPAQASVRPAQVHARAGDERRAGPSRLDLPDWLALQETAGSRSVPGAAWKNLRNRRLHS